VIRFKTHLKAGDLAPAIAGLDFKGHSTVLFFYPADFTPGCTLESCLFRDRAQDFKALGAELIGVSGDTEGIHAAFALEYRLPQRLLSDPKRRIRGAYGVPHVFGRLSGRCTFVIDGEGRIAFVFDSREQPQEHVHKTLEFLRKQS
jgi:peroxiredoxin Q/BCP